MNPESLMLQICNIDTSHRWPKWLRWMIIRWKFNKMKKENDI